MGENTPSGLEIDESELRAALDQVVLDSLRPVAVGVGALYAFFTIAHVLLLPPNIAVILSPIAAMTVVAMVGLYVTLGRRLVPSRWAHPLGAVVAAFVLLNTLLRLYIDLRISPESGPLQTSNVMLLIVGAGVLLLSARWLALVVSVSIAGVLVGMWLGPVSDSWQHFIFGLLSATVLSVIVHVARVQTTRRLESLRMQDERQKAALEIAYEREKTRRRFSETLYRAGSALSGTLDPKKLLELVLEYLAEIVSYDRASVMLPTTSNEEMEFVASRGFPPGMTPQMRILITENDLYERIYTTQEPLLIPDVSKWQGWQYAEGIPEAKSWMGVPLIRADQVVGMLSLTRETPNPYNDEEVSLTMSFAGQAAIALQNARLYDQLSRAFDQLERLDRTKSDFIAVVAHELRTPLTVLGASSQVLLDDQAIKQNELHRQMLESINTGTARMHEIVNTMLDMVKIDSRTLHVHPKPMSIPEQVRVICSGFKEAMAERSLTLRMEAIDDLPEIEADRELLRKAFYQLIVNAIKYTPDGGQITIRGQSLDPGQKVMPGGGVEIVVSDTGIGIDPAFHELIFEKFYQTGEVALHSSGKTKFKGGGPGLGLAIAKGIVEVHGGKLWVDSPGHDEEKCPGSHFHLVLPLRQSAAPLAEGKIEAQ
jgi:signal transduction histidine kinase